MSVPIPEWELNDGPIEEGYRDWRDNMNDNQIYRGFDHPEGPYVPNQPGMHTPYGTPYGQTPPPPPSPTPKKRRTGLWVLGIITAIIVLLIAIGIAVGSGGNSPSTPNDHFTPGAKKPGPSAKKWVPLATIKGNADKASDTIITTGGRIRLTYTFAAPNDLIAGAIYFLKEGTDIQKDGAVPDVMVTEPGKDSTILRKAKGQYFVQIIASGATYTVTVEEEK